MRGIQKGCGLVSKPPSNNDKDPAESVKERNGAIIGEGGAESWEEVWRDSEGGGSSDIDQNQTEQREVAQADHAAWVAGITPKPIFATESQTD